MEGCHKRPAEIQAKLHLPYEILFVSIRMHSFEVTSEQFDLKIPNSNHKPIQLSNEWRQVGYISCQFSQTVLPLGFFRH